MSSQATDNFTTGAFAAGGWTDLTSSFKDNYYFSIRRYPYSADLTHLHTGSADALVRLFTLESARLMLGARASCLQLHAEGVA